MRKMIFAAAVLLAPLTAGASWPLQVKSTEPMVQQELEIQELNSFHCKKENAKYLKSKAAVVCWLNLDLPLGGKIVAVKTDSKIVTPVLTQSPNGNKGILLELFAHDGLFLGPADTLSDARTVDNQFYLGFINLRFIYQGPAIKADTTN